MVDHCSLLSIRFVAASGKHSDVDLTLHNTQSAILRTAAVYLLFLVVFTRSQDRDRSV